MHSNRMSKRQRKQITKLSIQLKEKRLYLLQLTYDLNHVLTASMRKEAEEQITTIKNCIKDLETSIDRLKL